MAATEKPDRVVFRCNPGWEDVRETMAASRILTPMRQPWTMAGLIFAALLAESVARLVRGFVRKQSSGCSRRTPGSGT